MFFLAYHSSKVALIRREKKKFFIEQLSPLDSDVNPLYNFKNRAELVTGLESREVLLRTLSLKLKSKREVLAALPFQVESLLPYSREELILLPTLYSKKTETDVFLLASSQSTLKQHLDELSHLNLDPDTVSCVPLALYRFATYFFPQCPSLFVYHCDNDQHTLVVIREGKLTASQVQKGQDFERICAYVQKKYPEIQSILHTGVDNIPSPFIPLQLKEPSLAEYAIPIGLAFDAAKDDEQSVQLRQKSNLSNKQLKKRKTQLLGFIAACCFFMFSTLFLGQLHLKKQESEILEALGSSKGVRLHQWVGQQLSSLQSQKKSKIAVPTIPKVHEVLTWLSTHPMLSEDCSITHLSYQVINAPKLGSQTKTYAATLDLELSMPSSAIARSFHDALLKDTEMVDQKKPIQWSGDHGIYKTKFHLYPNKLR